MPEIAERLKAIVCERLDVKTDQVTMDSDFVVDLGADSLELVDLALAIEEAFALTIQDTDYVHLKKFRDAAAYLEARVVHAAS